jgi:hypothetical protein
MDLKFIALLSITSITIAGIVAAAIIARAAFAENASELGRDETELTLRIGTVFIVVLASLFFAVFEVFDKAIPFLSPIAAFVLGGIRSKA